jgi:hypothetical protein
MGRFFRRPSRASRAGCDLARGQYSARFVGINRSPGTRRLGLPRSRFRRGARDDEPAALDFVSSILRCDFWGTGISLVSIATGKPFDGCYTSPLAAKTSKPMTKNEEFIE